MDKENQKNGRGIFYGVIGVATLVVAIIGATFAYFTASMASNNGDITGNAASVSFGLRVEREETTDQTNGGLIPMSNSMVAQAVAGGGKPVSAMGDSDPKIACVDDNHNSVCQIYKVTVYNTSSAALYLDGYVTLTGGLSSATVSTDVPNNPTAMRWAQVFTDDTVGGTGYSTATSNFGTVLGASNTIAIAAIGQGSSGQNLANIYNGTETGFKAGAEIYSASGATINGTNMPAIIGNYIRLSDKGTENHTYVRTDLEDALVFNLFVPVNQSKTLYFVVWLHETGTSQNPVEGGPTENEFFGGIVTFQSGSGGEVSATFTGVAKVGA